jgi:L-lactate dehydrogenase complex protein LldF
MVCPVKIPFSKQLVNMRKYVNEENPLFKLAEKSMHSPEMFKLFSLILRLTPKPLLQKVIKEWSKYKALPEIPKRRFISL